MGKDIFAVIKLNKSNAMLTKLRDILGNKTLRPVYYVVFESHLCYASLDWV